MDDLIKLVRTYRLTAGFAERLRLADEIFAIIVPDLHLFIVGAVGPAADDVLQETLKGIATGMGNFKGNSDREFYGWCYQIARHKVADYIRKKSSDRLQPMEPALFEELFDGVTQDSALSAADRIDLDDAMKMLRKANPECYEYLWEHFIGGLDYSDIAAERYSSYDAVRMRIGRCLEQTQALLS